MGPACPVIEFHETKSAARDLGFRLFLRNGELAFTNWRACSL